MKATLRRPIPGWWDQHTEMPYLGITPAFREVYQVLEVLSESFGIGLVFAEFPCVFDAEYFRPVRTTDISLFKRMLAPKPKSRVRA